MTSIRPPVEEDNEGWKLNRAHQTLHPGTGHIVGRKGYPPPLSPFHFPPFSISHKGSVSSVYLQDCIHQKRTSFFLIHTKLPYGLAASAMSDTAAHLTSPLYLLLLSDWSLRLLILNTIRFCSTPFMGALHLLICEKWQDVKEHCTLPHRTSSLAPDPFLLTSDKAHKSSEPGFHHLSNEDW